MPGWVNPSTLDSSWARFYGDPPGNCVDTDDNGADFFHNVASENPQVLADPATPCPPPPAGSVIINEVLFQQRAIVPEEFVELVDSG